MKSLQGTAMEEKNPVKTKKLKDDMCGSEMSHHINSWLVADYFGNTSAHLTCSWAHTQVSTGDMVRDILS